MGLDSRLRASDSRAQHSVFKAHASEYNMVLGLDVVGWLTGNFEWDERLQGNLGFHLLQFWAL